MHQEIHRKTKRLRRRRIMAAVAWLVILPTGVAVLYLMESQGVRDRRIEMIVMIALVILLALFTMRDLSSRCPRCDRFFYLATFGPIPILSNPFQRKCIRCGFVPATER